MDFRDLAHQLAGVVSSSVRGHPQHAVNAAAALVHSARQGNAAAKAKIAHLSRSSPKLDDLFRQILGAVGSIHVGRGAHGGGGGHHGGGVHHAPVHAPVVHAPAPAAAPMHPHHHHRHHDDEELEGGGWGGWGPWWYEPPELVVVDDQGDGGEFLATTPAPPADDQGDLEEGPPLPPPGPSKTTTGRARGVVLQPARAIGDPLGARLWNEWSGVGGRGVEYILADRRAMDRTPMTGDNQPEWLETPRWAVRQ